MTYLILSIVSLGLGLTSFLLGRKAGRSEISAKWHEHEATLGVKWIQEQQEWQKEKNLIRRKYDSLLRDLCPQSLTDADIELLYNSKHLPENGQALKT